MQSQPGRRPCISLPEVRSPLQSSTNSPPHNGASTSAPLAVIESPLALDGSTQLGFLEQDRVPEMGMACPLGSFWINRSLGLFHRSEDLASRQRELLGLQTENVQGSHPSRVCPSALPSGKIIAERFFVSYMTS